MAYLLISTWSIYWLLIIVLPIKSTETAVIESFLLQLLFVLLVLITYKVVLFFVTKGEKSLNQIPKINFPQLENVATYGLFFSLIGLAASLYDKIYLQGIDYSQGVAVARESWKMQRSSEAGISSIFSAMGYLLGGFYFITAVTLPLVWSQLKKIKRVFLLVSVIIVVLAGSASIGGRSSFLLLASFCVATIALKKTKPKIKKIRINKPLIFNAIIIICAIALVAYYVVFITFERAEMNQMSVVEYIEDFMPFLHMEISPWFENITEQNPALTYSYPAIFSAVYLLHSFSICAAIISNYSQIGPNEFILFDHAINIARKIGINFRPSEEWFLSGRCPSLPGALLHDYGLCGVCVGAIILGVLCGVCSAKVKSRITMWSLTGFIFTGSVVVLSPYGFSLDILMGYFALFAFIISAISCSLTQRLMHFLKSRYIRNHLLCSSRYETRR
jgi:hypothetical protein